MKNYILLFAVKIENLKNLKYHYKKTWAFSIMCSKCKNEDEKLFIEED